MTEEKAGNKPRKKQSKIIPLKESRPLNILSELDQSLKSIEKKLDKHYSKKRKCDQ